METTHSAYAPRNDFAYSADGQFLAAPGPEESRSVEFHGDAVGNQVNVIRVKDGQKVAAISTPIGRIRSITWNQDGTRLAVGGLSDLRSAVSIYNVHHSGNDKLSLELWKQPDLSMLEEPKQAVVAIAFHPGGDKLAIGQVNRVHVLNLKTSERLSTHGFKNGKESVTLSYSPSGDRLASAFYDDTKVSVYDTDGRTKLYESAAPHGTSCVRFSPNGRRLVSAGIDGLVYLSDAESGHKLLTLDATANYRGSGAYNARVLFSKDGRRIAANNWRGHITIWEADLPEQ